MTATRVRRAAVAGVWLCGTLVLGWLAVLPVGFGVTAVARLYDGEMDVHHARTEVLGVVSPFAVDNDEVPVALLFGVLGVGILVAPLIVLAVLLRRSLPPGLRVTAGVVAASVLVALAPSVRAWI